MPDTIDPSAEQSVTATDVVPDVSPDDLDTAAIAAERSEAKLVMASHLHSFLHTGRPARHSQTGLNVTG